MKSDIQIEKFWIIMLLGSAAAHGWQYTAFRKVLF